MSVQAVEEDAEQVRGAGYHIIGGHKPERDNGQDDTRITWTGGDTERALRITIAQGGGSESIVEWVVKDIRGFVLSILGDSGRDSGLGLTDDVRDEQKDVVRLD